MSCEPYALLLTMAQAPAALRRGVPREQLRITIGKQHGRRAHPSDVLEQSWAAALSANPRLFDGSKFRLARIGWGEDGATVAVDLGLTSYKEYLGTNRLPAEQRAMLEKEGKAVHQEGGAFLSNALGCEALLLTSDGFVVLLQRSSAVATHSGLYNGPSGHPEPDRAQISASELAVEGDSAALATRAAAELFDSILQETHDETGVPRELLDEPRLTGQAPCPPAHPFALQTVQAHTYTHLLL